MRSKQIEGKRQSGIEMLLRELEDCDVMSELRAGTLAVAQHEGQNALSMAS